MHKRWLFPSVILLIAVFMVVPANAASPLTVAPRIPLRAGSTASLNWAGYADSVHSGSVTMANASFIVPTVQASKKSTYVAVWVGIDGYNDSTVEQTGILAESSHGSVSYSAWYEFYPSSPVYAPSKDKVEPGDYIVAWVQYKQSTNTFTTVIKDINAGWNFTSPLTAVSGADRSSAEWIVERPAVGGSLTTLANFGTAEFGQSYTGISGTCTATINGKTSSISAFNYVSITMVTSTGKLLATPSTLSGEGTSFSVTYVSSAVSPHHK